MVRHCVIAIITNLFYSDHGIYLGTWQKIKANVHAANMKGASVLCFACFLALMVQADASCSLVIDTSLSHRPDFHMKIITRKSALDRVLLCQPHFVSGS